MTSRALHDFIVESNRIESIFREPTAVEIEAHEFFLKLNEISVSAVTLFVAVITGMKAPLRDKSGMDVMIGNHLPPRGGPKITQKLEQILEMAQGPAVQPYVVHAEYETLHPFMDGNGRSGRVLWAWHMQRLGRDPFGLPFLQRWYYDSLDRYRK